MKTSKTLVPFVLVVCVAGVLMYGTLTRGHNWGGDFAAYIMQAKSLTEGAPRDFVEANRFTMEQSSYPLGPIAYPWGFPMLLAPFYAAFGLDMIALKMVGVLSYELFLVLLWFGFRRVHSPAWFICLVCLFALNPGMLAFGDNILSDLTFLLFSTLGLVLIGVVVVEGRRLTSRLWDSVLIAVAIAGASFVRTAGVLLLVSLASAQMVTYLQLRSQDLQTRSEERGSRAGGRGIPWVASASAKQLLVYLVPYAVFLSLVVVWGWALPGGWKYPLPGLKSLSLVSIGKQLHYYFDLPSAFFSGAPYRELLWGASIPLAVAGMMKRHKSDYPAIVYMMLTVIVYVILPWRQGLRYLFPILPFYVSFVLSGMQGFQGGATAVEGGLRKLLTYIPVVIVILCFGFSAGRGVLDNFGRDRETSSGPFAETSQAMFAFVAEHTDARSTVIFFKPRVMRLMTDRKSIAITRVEELSRGDYLCLYPRAAAHNQLLVPVVEDLVRKGAALLVYENSDFRVYSLGEQSIIR